MATQSRLSRVTDQDSKDLKKVLLKMMMNGEDTTKSTNHQTISARSFKAISPDKKSLEHMGDKAQTIIGGGLETTA